ncbi:MAG: NUDIX hydrolase [Candidatus Staskawiczbacteria bacterium]|nr:NUDIX hydrolase [Candidatus Staskawiczbacteria bacterium]
MTDFLQVVSVILVIRCKNKFLLVQRSGKDDIFPGFWQNMGGKVELGETIENTITREMMEEVGIKPESTPVFLQSYSWKKDEKSPVKLGLIFLINLKNDVKRYEVKICDELENYGWYTFEETRNLKTIGQDSPTGTLGQLSKSLKS